MDFQHYGLKLPLFAYLFLFGLTLCVFGNSLSSSEFVWDDEPIIVNNDLLRSWSSLPTLLATGYWQASIGSAANAQEYRPILMLSYFLNEQLFGLRPRTYRVMNMLIHASIAWLIFLLLQKYYARGMAMLAATLFTVLPAHSETVVSITGRSELLSFFFLLLTWLCIEEDKRLSIRGAILFTLALFTKENAVVFPFVWWLADWTFRPKAHTASYRMGSWGRMLLLVAFYLGMRFLVIGPHFKGGLNYFAGKSYLIRLLTMSRFTASYTLVSLVSGFRSYISYSRPLVPDAARTDWGSWFLLGLGSVIILGAVGAMRKKSRPAFWILMGFLFFLPTSNLLISLDSLGASRFLYIPSLAFCVLISQAITSLPRARWQQALIFLLGLSYACIAMAHNSMWATSEKMVQAMLRDNPNSDRGWNSLAVYRLRQHDWTACEKALEKARDLNPRDPDLFYNFGCLYEQKEEWNHAQHAFEIVVALRSQDPDAWLHLGLLAEREKKYQRALECYRKTFLTRPNDPVAHYNSARLLLKAGQVEPAVWHYQRFLKIAPSAAEVPIARHVLSLIYRDFPQFKKL